MSPPKIFEMVETIESLRAEVARLREERDAAISKAAAYAADWYAAKSEFGTAMAKRSLQLRDVMRERDAARAVLQNHSRTRDGACRECGAVGLDVHHADCALAAALGDK